MPGGLPKDGSRNPGWNNLQNERERKMFKLVGLPAKLGRKPQETYEEGLRLVEELKLIEQQLTEWEDKQPIEFLELLPWWEERKAYREQKALGNTPEVTWWQALHFLETSLPGRLATDSMWGIRKDRQKRQRTSL